MLWQQPHIKLSFHQVKLKTFQLKDSTTHWTDAWVPNRGFELLVPINRRSSFEVFCMDGPLPAESHEVQNHFWGVGSPSLHKGANVDPPIQKAFIIHVFHHGYLPFEELFPCMQFFSSMKFFFSDLVDDLSRASRIQTGSQNSYINIYIHMCHNHSITFMFIMFIDIYIYTKV